MKLIVGIGNPGRRYARTRHNVGWMVLDVLERRFSIPAPRERFEGLVSEGAIGAEAAVLLRPTTYVNESGRSVASALAWYRLDLEEVLVVLDDLSLPLGQVRVRRGGSSGGHKGLRSILETAGTELVPRLRVGIGQPAGTEAVDHVLSRFTANERAVVDRALERAADAVVVWATEGIERCMNEYNAAADGAR